MQRRTSTRSPSVTMHMETVDSDEDFEQPPPLHYGRVTGARKTDGCIAQRKGKGEE